MAWDWKRGGGGGGGEGEKSYCPHTLLLTSLSVWGGLSRYPGKQKRGKGEGGKGVCMSRKNPITLSKATYHVDLVTEREKKKRGGGGEKPGFSRAITIYGREDGRIEKETKKGKRKKRKGKKRKTKSQRRARPPEILSSDPDDFGEL